MMRGSVRNRLVVVTVLGLALTTMAACGRNAAPSEVAPGGGDTELTELGWEGQALESVGFSAQELAPAAAPQLVDPTAPASAGPGERKRKHPRWKRLRFGFRHGTLHGEAIVKTEEGLKTVVVQRGKVTAINGTTLTVRSEDGFELSWSLGNDKLRVIERRSQIQPSAVEVGAEVGVAGARDGDTPVARLIVIRRPR
jgi:hypothetical protein